MTEPRLTPALATHQGRRREDNEDAVGFRYPTDIARLRRDGAVFVVADGVGGLSDGQNASHIAVNGVIDAYYASAEPTTEARLLAAVSEVNRLIYNQFGGKSATTLTLAVFVGHEAVIAHVGDTRAYWFDGGRMTQLTEDQTLPVTQPNGKVKHKLLQAVGQKPTVNPDVTRHPIHAGGQLVLVSDGVTRYLDSPALAQIVAAQPPPEAVTEIVRRSNAGGGIDNISAAVIVVGPPATTDGDLIRHISTQFARGIQVELPPDLGGTLPAPPPPPPVVTPPGEPTPQVIHTAELPPQPAPRPPLEPAPPQPDTPPPPPPPDTRRSSGLELLLVLTILVALGATGWYLVQPALIFDSDTVPAATRAPATAPPSGEATAASVTGAPTTAPATHTPPPTATATPFPPNTGIASGVEVVFGASLTAYARIGSDVAAFTVEADTPYIVVDTFEANDGVRWYRLNVPANNQDGWIADYDLPDYQVQN